MKQKKLHLFSIILLAVCMLAWTSSAATVTVCTSGCNYTQISNATANAQAGDVINVSNGTYNLETFPILVNKTLTIASVSGAAITIINANSSNHSVLNITADNVIIRGFTLKGGGNSTIYEHVIDINANSATIQDNTFIVYNGNTAGIHIAYNKGNNHTIKGNTLRHKNAGEGWGIHAENLTQSLIEDNLCYGDTQWSTNAVEGAPGTCIEIGDADVVTIKDNIAYNLKYSFLTFVGEYPKPDTTGYMYKDCRDVNITNINILNNTVYNISRSWQKAINFKPCGEGGQPGGWTDHGNLTIGFNVSIGPNNTFYDINGDSGSAIVIDEDSVEAGGTGYIVGINNLNINYNIFYNNSYGVWNEQSDTVNATYNWWGSSTGPGWVGPGSGDNITSNVDYQPYCRNEACTAFGIETTPPGFSGSKTTNFSQVSNYSNVALVLDDGTTWVNFSSGVDLIGSTLEFSTYVSMATGYISIDTIGMPELDAPATITFTGLSGESAPTIYKDSKVCSATMCSNVAYDSATGTLTFNVIEFSTYFVSSNVSIGVDRLNYWAEENHIITINWTGSDLGNITSVIPSGWSFVSGIGCSNLTASIINCSNTAPGSNTQFTITVDNASAHEEFELSTITTSITSGASDFFAPQIRIIRISSKNIFHTLVEYGRGRGNYFFDSYAEDLAGSGHTGTGCSYLPANSLLELNFLHKLINTKQHFRMAEADAEDASFTCTYPDKNIVRMHSATEISDLGNDIQINYEIPRIEGSWERMGYVGMDFDALDYNVNENITITCSDINYSLPGAYGRIIVEEDAFTLNFRNSTPFLVSVAGNSGLIIGNGTQLVPISYTITNNEQYTISNVIIEIEAPPYADFIGVRGELWGTSLDTYRFEKMSFAPGESESLTLVARFNTSDASSITSVAFSNGINIGYVPCWEANSYNPAQYIQSLPVSDNATVNMSISTSVINILEKIILIERLVIRINETVILINSTLTEFYDYMNNTIWENLTARDLLRNCTNSTGDILTEINELTEFNEELVFLVTDSFGYQQVAQNAFENGDIDIAAQNLEFAKAKLEQAASILNSEKRSLKGETGFFSANRLVWLIPTIMIIVLLIAYLISKEEVVVEQDPPKLRKRNK